MPQRGSGYYRQKEKAKSYGKDLLINQVQAINSADARMYLINKSLHGHEPNDSYILPPGALQVAFGQLAKLLLLLQSTPQQSEGR